MARGRSVRGPGAADERRPPIAEQAQELVRRQIEFDVVDVRFPPSAIGGRYRNCWRLAMRSPTIRRCATRDDVEDVDAVVRFGDGDVFLTLLNRSQERRVGTLHGETRSVAVRDGRPAFCAAHVRDGAVVSAIFSGDACLGTGRSRVASAPPARSATPWC